MTVDRLQSIICFPFISSASATPPTSQHPVTVHGQSSASTARELDADLPLLLPPLPLLLLRCRPVLCYLLTSLVIAELSLILHDNHRCCIFLAISSIFRQFSLLSLAHFHESSNSSDQCIDLVPRFSLRQMAKFCSLGLASSSHSLTWSRDLVSRQSLWVRFSEENTT